MVVAEDAYINKRGEMNYAVWMVMFHNLESNKSSEIFCHLIRIDDEKKGIEPHNGECEGRIGKKNRAQ